MLKSEHKADNDKARQPEPESDDRDKGNALSPTQSIRNMEGQLEDIKRLLQETREERNKKEKLERAINNNYIAASLIIAFGIFLLTLPIPGLTGVFANVSGDLAILGASLVILGTCKASKAEVKVLEFDFLRCLSRIYYKELWQNKPQFYGLVILYCTLILLFVTIIFGLSSLF